MTDYAEVEVSIRVVTGPRDTPPLAQGEVVWRFRLKDGVLEEIDRNDVRLGFITKEIPGSSKIEDIALEGVEGDIEEKIEEAREARG